MRRVVSGNATIKPMKPNKAPQMERLRSKIAGFSPMALPIILGVTTMSVMICTTQNTNTAKPNTSQKFCPVSAALSMARKAVGMRARCADMAPSP